MSGKIVFSQPGVQLCAQPLLISQLSFGFGTFQGLGKQLGFWEAIKINFTKQVTYMRKSADLLRRATRFKGKMLILKVVQTDLKQVKVFDNLATYWKKTSRNGLNVTILHIINYQLKLQFLVLKGDVSVIFINCKALKCYITKKYSIRFYEAQHIQDLCEQETWVQTLTPSYWLCDLVKVT